MNRIHSALSLAVLVGLCSLLFMQGCDVNYSAERAFWQLNKQYGQVLLNIVKASDSDCDKLIKELKGILRKYPSWVKAADVQFLIGEIQTSRKDLKNAREAFERLVISYPDRHELCATSQFYLGLISAQEKDEKAAIRDFKDVFEKYPMTSTGSQMPLYIARYYASKGEREKSETAYKSALNDYENLININPFSKAVTVLNRYITQAYMDRKETQKAIDYLEQYAKKYPDAPAAPFALYSAAGMYTEFKKAPEKAIELYRFIIEKYPNSQMEKQLQFEIGSYYASTGNYDNARSEFDRLVNKYPDDSSLSVSAQLAIAINYEKAGKWNNALEEYNRIMTDYPENLYALRVPLIIAAHYKREKNEAEFERVMRDTLTRYMSIINRKNKSGIEPELWELVSAAYIMAGKPAEAVSSLKTLVEKFPSSPNYPVNILKIAAIYENELKDTASALKYYNQFLISFPSHQFRNLAQARVDSITSKQK